MPFDRDHVVVLCRGSAKWNAWRAENPTTTPNLVGLAFKPSERVLNAASNPPLNLKAARLHRAVLRFSALSGVDFENAELFGVDLAHSKLDPLTVRPADATRGLIVSLSAGRAPKIIISDQCPGSIQRDR